MTERELVSRLVKQLKEEFPEHLWYKLGDTFGGHKKPCDMIACVKGKFIAIEFKKDKGRLSENQIKYLDDILVSDGRCFIGVFREKALEIKNFANNSLLFLYYRKGKYDLSEFVRFILNS